MTDRAYHHGDLKDALARAALDMLRTVRVDDLKVADVARAVGVSSGAPYRHFEDRTDLLGHVAALACADLGTAMADAIEAHPPASLEGLIACGVAYTRFIAAQPERAHLMFGAARVTNDHPVARAAGEANHAMFLDALAPVMAAQGIAAEPAEFGTPLWAMVHGFATLAIAAPPMLDISEAALTAHIVRASRAYIAGWHARAANAPQALPPEPPSPCPDRG